MWDTLYVKNKNYEQIIIYFLILLDQFFIFWDIFSFQNGDSSNLNTILNMLIFKKRWTVGKEGG